MLVLHPGDQLWEYVAGGGGWGDPLERDPDLVLGDVLDGKVSADAAREAYGVVLAAGGGAVDHDATKALRASLVQARGAVTWLVDRGADGRG
jgi:N-methylhydantoinase B